MNLQDQESFIQGWEENVFARSDNADTDEIVRKRNLRINRLYREFRDKDFMPFFGPSYEEIEKIIRQIPNGKAPGKDLIVNELIKYGGIPMYQMVYDLAQKIF